MLDVRGYLHTKFDINLIIEEATIPPAPIPAEDRIYVLIPVNFPSIKDLFDPEKQSRPGQLSKPTSEEESDYTIIYLTEEEA